MKMLSQILMDYDPNKESPTKLSDGFYVFMLYMIVGIVEIVTYPIWRPIIWFAQRGNNDLGDYK